MEKPLLSIVIPTRNREYYCIEAIKSILSYNRDDYELCICDNSDSEKVADFINALQDKKRIVYKHIVGQINFVLNCDEAMRMAIGEYVCMIGDDDTVLPNIFDIAKWAKENNYENVTQRGIVAYFWPNSISKEGVLRWSPEYIDKKSVILDCKKQLHNFVKNGLINYSLFLPRVYHGLVKREVLEKVQKKTGHIIGGLSPDIYMSITVSCVMKDFVLLNDSYTIAGACPASCTSSSNTGGHRGRIEDIPHLFGRGAYVWDERVPRIYTVQTIWAETAMRSFVEMNRDDLIKMVNQGYLYAELIRKNRLMTKEIVSAIETTKPISSSIINDLNFLKYFVVKPILRLFRGGVKEIDQEGVSDITEAYRVYTNLTGKEY